MKKILSKFNKAKILVVGDIMLDRYWNGLTNRISSEAPVPIIRISNIKEKLGGAANVAMNVKTLGANSCLIGVTGLDSAATIIINKLNNAKVNHHLIQLNDFNTIIKLRVVAHNKQFIRIDFEKNKKINITSILKRKISILIKNKKYNCIIFSDYKKGVIKNVNNIIKIARKNNIPVLVDPKGNHFEKYRGATILTPNLKEFEEIVGKCHNKNDLIDKAKNLIDNLNLSALLITQSEKGMTLVQTDKPVLHLPTQANKVIDVIGAGDTVISTLAIGLSVGESLENICKIANMAAGLSVSKFGTATVTRNEIKETFFNLKKIVNLKISKENKLKKISTNDNNFNIINTKQLLYFSHIQELYDKIIMFANKNNLLTNFKGLNYPNYFYKNKVKIIANIKFVDYFIYSNKNIFLKTFFDILFLFKEEKNYKIITNIINSKILLNYIKLYISSFEKDDLIINNIKNR